jgi:Mn-dependent DtxR family transcriptional regulator
MDLTPLTDEMRRFILMNIPSIPYLETLLLMRGDENHSWSKEELAKRLFIDANQAKDLLIQLNTRGLIKKNDKTNLYQYHPYPAEMRDTINQLAAVYAKNLVEVTNLIHSNTERKAQKFANAFIWRKDK